MDIQVSTILAGLEQAYKDIRAQHPDATDSVIVVYQPPKGTNKRGHFWRESWRFQTEDGVKHPIDEILVSSHILSQGARSVLETLLHETAHSIAKARGIQDMSRQNRYHNKRFKALAEEVGLVVERDTTGSSGWITPDITDETAKLFAGTLETIDKCLVVFQDLQMALATRRRPRVRRTMRLACQCRPAVKLSVRIDSYTPGTVICTKCDSEFEEVER